MGLLCLTFLKFFAVRRVSAHLSSRAPAFARAPTLSSLSCNVWPIQSRRNTPPLEQPVTTATTDPFDSSLPDYRSGKPGQAEAGRPQRAAQIQPR